MKREEFISLMTKKISDQATDVEEQTLEDAIRSNEEYSRIDGALTHSSSSTFSKENLSQKLDNVWKQIENDKTRPSLETSNFWTIKVWQIAALLLLIAGSGLFIYNIKKLFPLHSNNLRYVRAADREIKTTLADGTTVLLKPNALLSYNSNFGKEKRFMKLIGSAFFDVKSNKNMPLLLEASNIEIKVLGTAFTVDEIKENKKIEISLFRGLIQLSKKYDLKDTLTVIPGQKIIVDYDTTGDLNYQIALFDPSIFHSNNSDTITFKNEKLQDLIFKLEKKYGVSIEIKNNNLKDKRYTGTFTNETLSQALEALKLSYQFSYKKIDSTITIN